MPVQITSIKSSKWVVTSELTIMRMARRDVEVEEVEEDEKN